MTEHYEDAALLIEIRGIYDGWSVKQMPDGTLVNRWPPNDRRHAPTQQWIEAQKDDGV